MGNRNILLIIVSLGILSSCSNSNLEEKGFPVVNTTADENIDDGKAEGINKDSLIFETRPSSVLLTGVSNIRLATVYKVNLNKKHGTTFIGSNNFLYNDSEQEQGNNWNGHLMPGLEGVYGYNLVNVSLYDFQTNTRREFFDKPVLIKTVYYPAFSNDTLNNSLVKRNYIFTSVYDDDTNKDGFINAKDLRRFYLFNINGERQSALVPENYSVFKSEYDEGNDVMFVFARLDKNANGQIEDSEPVTIFWINLQDPTKTMQL
ncbi:MAG: hypothetical protein IPO27_17140 [Bacteroidetes bacterium]|nr:hypothetical protein [Bacteroidota bacterium]